MIAGGLYMALFRKKQQVTAPEAPVLESSSQQEKEAASNGRQACLLQIEQLFRPEAAGQKGVVLKLYIENFKRLNEVFGHDYCEDLLVQIISYLEEKTGQKVYRYIGVEFILILNQYTQGQAQDLADEILERFDSVWKIGTTDCLCSSQIGMCSYPGHASSAKELLKFLDLAVSKASQCGPNQSIMYDSTLHKQLIRYQTIARYLSTALEKHELEVRYRPTYNTRLGKFTRAEYYMRIFIKDLGFIGSSEFIPIAEDSGQIRSIEYYALDQVGSCISKLMAQGTDFESVSLPISPVLFLQDDFLTELSRILEKYKIPKGKLALEINESALTAAYLNINIMMQNLSEMGVELILNDFGTGYSGISSILELPVDTLKLERMFIWQMETNPQAAFVIQGLVQIARNLELNIIAEGVETENQIAKLTECGCEYQQGFYYSPTLEEAELLQIMDKSLENSFPVLESAKQNAMKTHPTYGGR